ncbi:MAG TPA: IMP cyclohydrolase [Candidatus Hydrogenedentes bacterium]|nr:IMP cyclohydrolase [Candidatus Hydrogenedentota bacterium]HOL75614.1 IMP cyclohydrolase [Candidatus Hydrogenedentota bacterium]HPO84393.1 IMP cyclohydrolase [Candidatus Hydrogenedentota bacterium]
MGKIRRAIISCHDKTGLVEFAKLLRDFEVEIISTAGTLKVLQDSGIAAISIADYTGTPEMMDGRVKSLHVKVHAGLLGIRDNKLHCEQLQAASFEWIDLVVVNLRPAEALFNSPGVTVEEVIEQIDIGGATLIRSAAKNFRYVTVAVKPERYSLLMHEMLAHDGAVTFPTRYRLAQEAFECTAHYDKVIADYLSRVPVVEK